jgi:hypothetical protein
LAVLVDVAVVSAAVVSAAVVAADEVDKYAVVVVVAVDEADKGVVVAVAGGCKLVADKTVVGVAAEAVAVDEIEAVVHIEHTGYTSEHAGGVDRSEDVDVLDVVVVEIELVEETYGHSVAQLREWCNADQSCVVSRLLVVAVGVVPIQSPHIRPAVEAQACVQTVSVEQQRAVWI